MFVATGWAGDAEMDERIARHRAERPAHWRTVEERVELAGALRDADAEACVVVDCLSLWVANLMDGGADDEQVQRLGLAAASIAASRSAPTIAVTNEVGQGVVPASRSGRRFRDLLGRVNASWASEADRVALVVAGHALPLPAADWLIEELQR